MLGQRERVLIGAYENGSPGLWSNPCFVQLSLQMSLEFLFISNFHRSFLSLSLSLYLVVEINTLRFLQFFPVFPRFTGHTVYPGSLGPFADLMENLNKRLSQVS